MMAAANDKMAIGKTAELESGALKAALGSVIGAVDRRTTVPILSNVLLQFEPGTLAVVATNLDMEVRRVVPADAVKASWSTTVSGHVLKSMADKMPLGAQVSLALEVGNHGDVLVVRSGRSRFSLPVLPVDDFPVLAAADFGAQFEMAGAELLAMINFVRPAISTEETRYYLNGIAIERVEGELIFATTDGRRLCTTARHAPEGSETMPAPIILPRQCLPVLDALCAEAVVTLEVSANRVRVAAGEVTMTTKLVDGTFPDWRRVVPSSNDKLVQFDPAEVAKAVERVAVVATDKTRGVSIMLEPGLMRLVVVSAENGSAQEEIGCDYDGPEMSVGVNATYFLALLARFSGDVVQMLAADASAPILFRAGPDAASRAVLMPMRI